MRNLAMVVLMFASACGATAAYKTDPGVGRATSCEDTACGGTMDSDVFHIGLIGIAVLVGVTVVQQAR
jgi:hypothetical protein